MTHDFIPTSREVVARTRKEWNMTKDEFGPVLGVTGEFAGQVEFGRKKFDDERIAPGCAHPDEKVRRFWQAYRTARRHEQDVAIIENCIATEIS